ncbi:DNA phosphorothioation-dependent restriction protein DptG [Romboutsia sedimentorum]|uniref:DNA phosphorothioation-dependent restriction protein DptG n=1 Tax=Romboutsia sedimentorum TaxID=1368474 RepID=A0ABT7E5K9_9FIRM|nr:DNA phosphorothioation-dependent restriction protein DptG [Romboutsia sedimentorum]MDK2562218.1 DNA phosphorothioation-dependent restriction protein DptG [Romboutsia sedimentorum]
MQFIIDEQKFKKDYGIDNNSVKHSTAKNIKILPYTTKYEKKHKEQIESFNSCIGEFCRLIYNKKLNNEEVNLKDIDIFIKDVESNSSDKIVLKGLIKNIFFDENDNMNTFHPKLLNYINMPKSDYNSTLAIFLYDVLLNNEDGKEIKEKINQCFDYKPDNVMELLILNNLPELKNDKEYLQNYKCICSNVSKLFKIDLEFILNDPELFTNEFQSLLEYYYFFYVSQLSIKLSRFFDSNRESTEEIYFNLDWEATSKSRSSYILGWKMLESNLKSLFSHANTLEILNINNIKDSRYDYIDINQMIDQLSNEEKLEFTDSLKSIKSQYKKVIIDVKWDEFKQVEKYSDDPMKQEIYDLFKCIDYQFIKGGRLPRYTAYRNWFEEYCKSNFLRRRGSLGYALNITQERLLFITKLCIKDKEKIKLKDLFEEYKKRGIYFDRDSQSKIVDLFEKLNIIEKKSDSGDAQYVKSIL